VPAVAVATLEPKAYLKLRIEELQQHNNDGAKRLVASVTQHLDHPGGLH